jgi:hypothetical protein
LELYKKITLHRIMALKKEEKEKERQERQLENSTAPNSDR